LLFLLSSVSPRFTLLSPTPPPPRSPLFPYTTLFRSRVPDSVRIRPFPGSRRRRDSESSRDARRGRRRRRQDRAPRHPARGAGRADRKSTRLNSSHQIISYAVFCLKKKKNKDNIHNNK